jgi:hypothetical protein
VCLLGYYALSSSRILPTFQWCLHHDSDGYMILDAVTISETSVNLYQTIQRNIPEGSCLRRSPNTAYVKIWATNRPASSCPLLPLHELLPLQWSVTALTSRTADKPNLTYAIQKWHSHGDLIQFAVFLMALGVTNFFFLPCTSTPTRELERIQLWIILHPQHISFIFEHKTTPLHLFSPFFYPPHNLKMYHPSETVWSTAN